MSNAYRRSAENTGLNWAKQFRDFYADRSGMNVEGFVPQLEKEDKWAPEEVLSKLVDNNLGELFAASERLQKMSRKNSFYAYYKKIVDKAILLLVERSPESFESLTPAQKEAVFGTKIEMPDEDQFYGQVYAVLENPAALASAGTFYTGQNFEDILERLVTEEKVLSPEVAGILQSLDAKYAIYFIKRNEKAKAEEEPLPAEDAPDRDYSPAEIKTLMEKARNERQ